MVATCSDCSREADVEIETKEGTIAVCYNHAAMHMDKKSDAVRQLHLRQIFLEGMERQARNRAIIQ